jgi:hypothetical protein
VGTGTAGDRTPLRRAPGDGGPPLDLQARGEGDRLAARQCRDVHGQVGRALRGLELPHPHEPMEQGRRAIIQR